MNHHEKHNLPHIAALNPINSILQIVRDVRLGPLCSYEANEVSSSIAILVRSADHARHRLRHRALLGGWRVRILRLPHIEVVDGHRRSPRALLPA